MCILSPFKLYNAPGIGIRLFARNIDKSTSMQIEKATNVLLERASEGVVHFDGEPFHMGKKINISLISKVLDWE